MLLAGVWLILRGMLNSSDSKALMEMLFGLIGLLLASLDKDSRLRCGYAKFFGGAEPFQRM
jgi:hypothetical protein